MDPSALANGIQLSIAPVFLLTAVAALIGALAPRLGRVIDRARAIEDKLDHLDSAPLPQTKISVLEHELQALGKRARMINWSMILLVLCATLIGVTILELFLSELGTGKVMLVSRWVPISFIGGLACFIAALLCFLREVLLTTQSVRIERWKN
jgi:hypothetical protein